MKRASVLILGALTFWSGPAHGDGFFVWRNRGTDILEPAQKAVVLFEEGWEDLILEVKYAGAVEDFGWIVPLPSEPEMEPADAILFEELSSATQEPKLGRSRSILHMGLAEAEEVRVLKRERVGVYDATVLSAASGKSLENWLSGNGFVTSEGAPEILQSYTDKNWVFVAMRIAVEVADSTLGEQLSSGTVQPIRFGFPTPDPVYPLKISSMMGGKTEVLLYVVAEEQLVNASCKHAKWNNHIYGRFGTVPSLEALMKTRNPNGRDDWLSKLRATLQPDEMEDVTFEAYDPVVGFQSAADSILRAEAATHIGRVKSPAGAQVLMQYLTNWLEDVNEIRGATRARRDVPDMPPADVASAIWALGEIGGEAAVDVLLSLSEKCDSPCRIEAVNALARIGTKRALPTYVAGMARQSVYRYDFFLGIERNVCFEHLVSQGDASCIPELRKLSAEHYQESDWHGKAEVTLGLQTVAALAACGDGEAAELIRSVIVASSGHTKPSALRIAAAYRGADRPSPWGIWTGQAILKDSTQLPEWSPFNLARQLLEANPGVRDEIFRQAAKDRKTPDAGKAILLAHLNAPDEKDLALLKRIWRRSFGWHEVFVELSPEAPSGDWRAGRLNVNACNVVYALARLKDVDGLLRLWETRPLGDEALTAELAYSIACCDSERGMPAVTEYVTEGWNQLVSRQAFRDYLTARIAELAAKGNAAELYSIDYGYRSPAFRAFIRHHDRGRAVTKRLMSDPSLHPFVRVWWISQWLFFHDETGELLTTARASLANIEAEAEADPLLLETVRQCARNLDRQVEIREKMKPLMPRM